MRVGVVQLEAGMDFDPAECSRVATAAAMQGCEVVVFPELYDVGYRLDQIVSGGHAEDEICRIAQACHVAIAAGVCGQSNDHVTNRLLVADAAGSVRARYDTRHLFSAGSVDETSIFAAGKETVLAELGGVRFGLSICFDLRFPAHYQQLSAAGAQILLTVAAWPQARIADWEILLRARALENQCFSIGVNYGGSNGTLAFGGQSLVVGPDGGVLLACKRDTLGLQIVELDLARIDSVRASLPLANGTHKACF